MKKLLLVFACIFALASVGLGQLPPGGQDWLVEYKSIGTTVEVWETPTGQHVTETHQWTPIGQPEWQTTARTKGSGLSSNPTYRLISVASSGTVTIRMTWQGQGNAPSKLWTLTDSSATYLGQGSCSNGLGNQEVSITGGGESKGKKIKQYTEASNKVEYTVSPSTTATPANQLSQPSENIILSAGPTTRSATITRSDGGALSLVGDQYSGHTLLSWSGVHDNVDYDNLADGGPGLTIQTLTGVAAGMWSTKNFTNPQTQQQYNTMDITVAWGGSTSGAQTQTPPNPLTVVSTTYLGNMPQFNPEGTAPKTEDWTYKITDN
jgi:hypothetical protein